MTTLTVAGAAARPSSMSASQRPANQLAESITGRPYVSHSQIALMRACPRKFAFQYIEGVGKDFIASSLVFGGAVHAALESYFQALMEGRIEGLEALMMRFRSEWELQCPGTGEAPLRLNKGESIESLQETAERLLKAFLDSPLARPVGDILAVEEERCITLDADLPDIVARVDLVTQTADAVHVVDWKTSRSRWTQEKAIQSAEQLVLYGVTLHQLCAALHLPVRLHFGILTKAKSPAVQVITMPIDAQRAANLTESMRTTWADIQRGSFQPNPSPINCTTCPFKSRCPIYAA